MLENDINIDDYFSMNMVGLARFFDRLEPLVMAGVNFKIHNGGIMIYAFIPESQLPYMLIGEELE